MNYFSLNKEDFEFYLPYFYRTGVDYGVLEGMPLDGLVPKYSGFPRLSAYFGGGIIGPETFCLSIAVDEDTPYSTAKIKASKDAILADYDNWKTKISPAVNSYIDQYRSHLTTVEIVPFSFTDKELVVRLKLDENGYELQAAYSNVLGFGYKSPCPDEPGKAVLAAIRRASMCRCKQVAILDFSSDTTLWQAVAKNHDHLVPHKFKHGT